MKTYNVTGTNVHGTKVELAGVFSDKLNEVEQYFGGTAVSVEEKFQDRPPEGWATLARDAEARNDFELASRY